MTDLDTTQVPISGGVLWRLAVVAAQMRKAKIHASFLPDQDIDQAVAFAATALRAAGASEDELRVLRS